jgi:hypothetical protein
MFASGWETYVWFWVGLEAWQVMGTRPFGTQIRDQDQTQDEDKV